MLGVSNGGWIKIVIELTPALQEFWLGPRKSHEEACDRLPMLRGAPTPVSHTFPGGLGDSWGVAAQGRERKSASKPWKEGQLEEALQPLRPVQLYYCPNECVRLECGCPVLSVEGSGQECT